MFRVDVQKPLTDLVKRSIIARQLLPTRIFLYLNADKDEGENQFKQRLAVSHQSVSQTLPTENIRIAILVAVIHTEDRTF